MKKITKRIVDLVEIPKCKNKFGWYVYVAMIMGRRVEFRFDWRPSPRLVKMTMLKSEIRRLEASHNEALEKNTSNVRSGL